MMTLLVFEREITTMDETEIEMKDLAKSIIFCGWSVIVDDSIVVVEGMARDSLLCSLQGEDGRRVAPSMHIYDLTVWELCLHDNIPTRVAAI